MQTKAKTKLSTRTRTIIAVAFLGGLMLAAAGIGFYNYEVKPTIAQYHWIGWSFDKAEDYNFDPENIEVGNFAKNKAEIKIDKDPRNKILAFAKMHTTALIRIQERSISISEDNINWSVVKDDLRRYLDNANLFEPNVAKSLITSNGTIYIVLGDVPASGDDTQIQVLRADRDGQGGWRTTEELHWPRQFVPDIIWLGNDRYRIARDFLEPGVQGISSNDYHGSGSCWKEVIQERLPSYRGSEIANSQQFRDFSYVGDRWIPDQWQYDVSCDYLNTTCETLIHHYLEHLMAESMLEYPVKSHPCRHVSTFVLGMDLVQPLDFVIQMTMGTHGQKWLQRKHLIMRMNLIFT